MEIEKGLDYVRGNSRAVILTTRRDGRPAMAPVTVAVVDDQRCIVRFEILSAGPDVAG